MLCEAAMIIPRMVIAEQQIKSERPIAPKTIPSVEKVLYRILSFFALKIPRIIDIMLKTKVAHMLPTTKNPHKGPSALPRSYPSSKEPAPPTSVAAIPRIMISTMLSTPSQKDINDFAL